MKRTFAILSLLTLVVALSAFAFAGEGGAGSGTYGTGHPGTHDVSIEVKTTMFNEASVTFTHNGEHQTVSANAVTVSPPTANSAGPVTFEDGATFRVNGDGEVQKKIGGRWITLHLKNGPEASLTSADPSDDIISSSPLLR